MSSEFRVIGDDLLWRSNPVWCLERLLEKWNSASQHWVNRGTNLRSALRMLSQIGVPLPRQQIQSWVKENRLSADILEEIHPPRLGVVGLVVDKETGLSWVVPLNPKRNDQWSLDPNLPFANGSGFQALFLKFISCLNLTERAGVPERYAYHFPDLLGQRASGGSMDIAGLLAILRHENPNNELLDRACCIVQCVDQKLTPVHSIEQKMNAFRRELETGTLLVRTPDCDPQYDALFGNVWVVGHLRELAQKANEASLFATLLNHSPLSRKALERVNSQIVGLYRDHHHYADALNLAERAKNAGFVLGTPQGLGNKLDQSLVMLNRHLGHYQKSVTLAEEYQQQIYQHEETCHEERAEADIEYAASLYSQHNFQKILQLLGAWVTKFQNDKRILSAFTRVKILNTLGRTKIMLGSHDWVEEFKQSEAILLQVAPSDLPRLWTYVAQGYLRFGRLDEAASVIRQIKNESELEGINQWFLAYLQADLARLKHESWIDPSLDNRTPSEVVGHPIAFYLMATARQKGCDQVNAIQRLRKANQFLQGNPSDHNKGKIQSLFCMCNDLLIGFLANESEQITVSIRAIRDFVCNGENSHLEGYYLTHLNRLNFQKLGEIYQFVDLLPFV